MTKAFFAMLITFLASTNAFAEANDTVGFAIQCVCSSYEKTPHVDGFRLIQVTPQQYNSDIGGAIFAVSDKTWANDIRRSEGSINSGIKSLKSFHNVTSIYLSQHAFSANQKREIDREQTQCHAIPESRLDLFGCATIVKSISTSAP